MNDRTFIRGFEGFHDTRFLALTIIAVLVFGIVMSAFVKGFQGSPVSRSADAMVFLHSSEPRTPSPPPAIPAP